MMSYPTPPLTSSPKNSSFAPQPHDTYNPPSQTQPGQDTSTVQYQTQYQQSYDSTKPPPNQASQPQTYPLPFQHPNENPLLTQDVTPHSQSYQQLSKLPAQETYFHSYSAPSSPTHAQPPGTTTSTQAPTGPPRRRSSPIRSPLGQARIPRPGSRSPLRQRSPGNPNYYSNSPIPISLSPKPTPYNLNRPQPRPGFIGRLLNVLEGWIRGMHGWTKRNPITAGLVTFVPVLAIAGIVKVVRGVGKITGFVEKEHPKPLRTQSSRNVDGEAKRDVRWREDEEEAGGGWGLDAFRGFGGSKGGPLERMMKIVQMLV